MPNFKGTFKDWDIDAIMWYMKSISGNYHGDLKYGNTLTPPPPKSTAGAATLPATQPAN